MINDSTNESAQVSPLADLFLHGMMGGLIAGLVFVLGKMVLNLALNRPFFGPLQLTSTLLLGTKALDPSYSLVTASVIGLIVHLCLSALYGMIFVGLLGLTGQLGAPTKFMLLYGALFGLGLWLVNYYGFAWVMFPQFTLTNPFWNGFVAHTFSYGIILGAYIAEAWPQPESGEQ